MADNINLLQDVSLYWNPGWGSWTLRAQKYQTLQDPAAPVDPPYQRMPQLLFTTGTDANIGLGTPLNLKFDSEFVSFAHPTKQEGERFIAYPSVSLPLTSSWGYVTPKFGVHYTDYSLNSRSGTDQEQGNASRTLPIVSLASYGAIVGCVSAGAGVALVPKGVFEQYAKGAGCVGYEFAELTAIENLFYWHENAGVHPAREAFVAMLREEFAEASLRQ